MSTPIVIPNFNNTTPAAPVGQELALWQSDTLNPSDISVYVRNTGGVDSHLLVASANITLVDQGQLVVVNNNSAVTVNLNSAAVTNTFCCSFQNEGTVAATLIPTSGNIAGNANVSVAPGQGGQLFFDGTNWHFNLGGAAQPYDLGTQLPGLPAGNTTYLIWEFPRTVVFPNNFVGAKGKCLTNPTANAVFVVLKNAVYIANIVINASGNFFFTTNSGAVTYNSGDYMTIQTPNPQDSTLADVGWVLVGVR